MSTPSLSVVSVTYNLIDAGRKELFRQAFASVQAQQGVEVEHVIIDGASTDGTQDLIETLTSDHTPLRCPVRVTSEPDKGLYDAMNKGVEVATGDYVIFLNSDDYLADNHSLSRLMKAAGDARPDYIYGQQVTLAEDGTTSLWHRMSPKTILDRMPFGYASIAFARQAFLDAGGHDLAFRITADYDLVFRLLAAGAQGVHVPHPTGVFRHGGISMNLEATDRDHIAVWRKNLTRFCDLSDVSDAQMIAWKNDTGLPLRVLGGIITHRDTAPVVRRSALKALTKTLRRTLFARRRASSA